MANNPDSDDEMLNCKSVEVKNEFVLYLIVFLIIITYILYICKLINKIVCNCNHNKHCIHLKVSKII